MSLPAIVMAGLLVVSSPAAAAVKASGTLAVSATVTSSIGLAFTSSAEGVTLGGTGTSAATMAFGTISPHGGTVPTGATRVVHGTTSFTYSSPFDVTVTEQNSSSSCYTLAALLGASSADTFAVDAVTLSTNSQTITATGTYANSAQHTLALTVPYNTVGGSAISDTVDFTAIAN
ncbi:MAG: hypothetical protein WBG27_09140 [Candidatus Aquilonibacter sp.]